MLIGTIPFVPGSLHLQYPGSPQLAISRKLEEADFIFVSLGATKGNTLLPHCCIHSSHIAEKAPYHVTARPLPLQPQNEVDF